LCSHTVKVVCPLLPKQPRAPFPSCDRSQQSGVISANPLRFQATSSRLPKQSRPCVPSPPRVRKNRVTFVLCASALPCLLTTAETAVCVHRVTRAFYTSVERLMLASVARVAASCRRNDGTLPSPHVSTHKPVGILPHSPCTQGNTQSCDCTPPDHTRPRTFNLTTFTHQHPSTVRPSGFRRNDYPRDCPNELFALVQGATS
jgi:hypothetical protein